jgi:hypothetical protein
VEGEWKIERLLLDVVWTRGDSLGWNDTDNEENTEIGFVLD